MNARKVAINILDQVLYHNAYSNIALNNALNKEELNLKDKALVTEIVYGTIKYKFTIDYIIASFVKDTKNVDNTVINILRTAIYQMRFLSKVPDYAVVNEAVNITKKVAPRLSNLVNGVLRNYIRNKDKEFYKGKDPIFKIAFDYSFEPWMVNLFINQYGKDRTYEILKGLNLTPGVTVRVNSLKSNYEDTFAKLQDYGYEVEEGYVCPEAITIKKGSNIESNPEFKQGKITVQDESAMLVAPILDLEQEHIVFDMCSAPGGKATHIAEIMENTGEVIASDLHQSKLSLIEENANRLGITNIHCKVMDAAVFNEELVNKAHRILIDVPCSGIGIIKKKPEIKWNKAEQSMKSLIEIQRNIMTNASKYLKSQGVLVYSTCTLNKEENEKNIKWFLNNNKNFVLEKVYFGKVDNIIYHDEGYVTILPNENMDGFFIAKFKKI